MFPRGGGQSTLTPEVPRRRNRKGLSSSGHNLNTLGQQKYDRDALAFNHYIGYLKQPLRRHLSSDISYLVPSMPNPSSTSANQPTTQLVNRDVNQPPPLRPPPPSSTTTNTQYDQLLNKSPESIYSAPRRQRSFRKQRSLDNPTNDNQSKQLTNCSNAGPNEMKSSTTSPANQPIGYLSIASSVPHLPQQQQQQQFNQSPSSQLVNQSISVSTEGLIQHIISQQSQIERLSKQQDFLTQQLLISRETGSFSEMASKRSGRSRTRSTTSSSKGHHQHSDSLSSLRGGESGVVVVKRRSSSREKIQEQLHAQQARVQQHIQQLEAQLELIRDIRTNSRPTSRSHSQAPSMRDGSSCPPEEGKKESETKATEELDQRHLKRPLSADPKWLKSDIKLPSSQDKQLKLTKVNSVLVPTLASVDQGTINSSDDNQLSSVIKPKLMLTNPSEEESKDDDEISRFSGTDFQQSSKSPLIVNRPTLIDQDDGIPFMDDELIDEPPDDSDELETVFEFDKSANEVSGGQEIDHDDDEIEDYEDWEDDDELDYYSRGMGSPQAETDQWSRLMEEDILKAREEMDRQRSLMDRQELDLSDQRQQLMDTDDGEMINYPIGQLNHPHNPQTINQQLEQINNNENHQTLTIDSNQIRRSPQMSNQQIGQPISQNLIPLTQSRSRSSSPFVINQQQSTFDANNYSNQLNFSQGNIFNFNEMHTKQFQSQLTSKNLINQQQQQRLSPNYFNQQQSSNLTNQQQRLSPNPLINQQQQQIATSAGSSFSPVINSRSNRGANDGGLGGTVPPRIIDRQISTPVSLTSNQIKSPNSNYIKRPSVEDQPSDLYVQSSMLRSKMLIPPSINLASVNQFNQPTVPPRRKPVTPRSRSPIQGPSNVTSPSYRIQTNKNRMAGQQINISSSPRRPQRSTSQTDQQMTRKNQQQSIQQLNHQPSSSIIRSNNLISSVNQPHLTINQQSNQQPVTSSVGSTYLGGRLTSRLYSPKPTTALTTPLPPPPPPPSTTIKPPPTINRPESMFRPITSKQLKVNQTAAPIIKIDPARSTSNLNLSSQSPTSFNQLRRSPSPQPQQSTSSSSSSSAASFLKRAGSFIQRNTTFMNKNQSKNQESQSNNHQHSKHHQQLRGQSPSPVPITTPPSNNKTILSRLSPITNLFHSNNQSGNTLKVDLQSIRSNRSSRASSPAPPSLRPPPPSQQDPPTRKLFTNKDTVEAGSFSDHFNHYYAPQSEPKRRPLSQQFTHSSTGELNKLGRSITPMRDVGNHHGKQSVDNQLPLRRTPSNSSNHHHKPANQSTANALIDAPMHYERRQTLPEITNGLGLEDKTTAKEEAILRNLAGKKKHSLPQDDLHEVPLIPGWEREKVATLAHEAREARMNQPTGPVVHLTAATNWLIKYKFMGLIIFFNAILMYLFMRILKPINGQLNERDDQSRSI